MVLKFKNKSLHAKFYYVLHVAITTFLYVPLFQISNVAKLGNSTFEIEVTSDVIALYVWISSDFLGLFSDNGFPMFSSTVKVVFKSVDDVSLPQLMSRLRVRSITDVKNSDSVIVG